METSIYPSRSSPALTARHSRRSFPNLTHLSLAPLSSRFPLSDDDGEEAAAAAAPVRRSRDPSADKAASGTRRQPPPNLSINLSHTSYIQGKSAPTTPSILSQHGAPPPPPGALRHSKSHRSRKRVGPPTYVHDAAVTSASGPRLLHKKALSTTGILEPGHRGPAGITAQPPSSIRVPGSSSSSGGVPGAGSSSSATATSADEWLHRAGLAISTQSLETKGQSWLVSRASSTSLVNLDAPNGNGNGNAPTDRQLHETSNVHLFSPPGMGLAGADDYIDLQLQHSPVSSRFAYGSRFGSRAGSRTGSRAGSARTSRRGSRVGNRSELAMTNAAVTPGRRSVEFGGGDYFGEGSAAVSGGSTTPVEPDFVDPRELDEAAAGAQQVPSVDEYVAERLAEDEVRALAAERGFGFGGWMDRVLGMSLFSADGDDDDDDDEAHGGGADGDEDRDEAQRRADYERREAERRHRQQIGRLVSRPSVRVPPPAHDGADAEGGGGGAGAGGGWQDAAWLLSVASRVIL